MCLGAQRFAIVGDDQRRRLIDAVRARHADPRRVLALTLRANFLRHDRPPVTQSYPGMQALACAASARTSSRTPRQAGRGEDLLDDDVSIARARSRGIAVSPVCLGRIPDEDLLRSVNTACAAFDAGVNFFFVSCGLHWRLYALGRRALAKLLRHRGIRDQIVVAAVSYTRGFEEAAVGDLFAELPSSAGSTF